MFGELLKKIVGSKNDRELKRIQPLDDEKKKLSKALGVRPEEIFEDEGRENQ